MHINKFSQNTYFHSPPQISFAAKQPKILSTPLNKQKYSFCVENSIDEFSNKLHLLLDCPSTTIDNIRNLIRTYVPKTKLINNCKMLDDLDLGALYEYTLSISMNHKFHVPKKRIIIDWDKKNESSQNIIIFNDIVHEMTHNLQINHNKTIYNTVFKDFYNLIDSF